MTEIQCSRIQHRCWRFVNPRKNEVEPQSMFAEIRASRPDLFRKGPSKFARNGTRVVWFVKIKPFLAFLKESGWKIFRRNATKPRAAPIETFPLVISAATGDNMPISRGELLHWKILLTGMLERVVASLDGKPVREDTFIKPWVGECCEMDAKTWVSREDLEISWKRWAQAACVPAGTSVQLLTALRQLGLKEGGQDGKATGLRGFRGMRIKTAREMPSHRDANKR